MPATPPQDPAPKQGLSTSFNSGAANSPNAQPAQVGGIAANQLAADNDALDVLLSQAIDNGSVEEVKAALKSGASLKLDWTYACPVGSYFYGAGPTDRDSLASARNQLRIGEIKASMTEGSKTQGDLLAHRFDMGYLPSSCQKMHVQHALSMLTSNGGSAKLARGKSEARESWVLSEIETRKAEEIFKIRYNRAPTGNDVFDLDKERDRFAARVEILMLLDANTPGADKAFYPQYVVGALNNGPMADRSIAGVVKLRQAAVIKWFIQQYFAAEGAIAKARILKEPAHLNWDTQLSTATKAPLNLFDPEAAKASSASWAKQNFGKDPALAYMSNFFVAGLVFQQRVETQRRVCDLTQTLKSLKEHERQFHHADDQAALPGVETFVAKALLRFDDSTANFVAAGLARSSPSEILADFYKEWSTPLTDPQRRVRPLRYDEGYVDAALTHHAMLDLFQWLLSSPKIKTQMSTEYGKADLYARLSTNFGAMSGPAIRVLLGEGFLDPGARDAGGRTPTDAALALDRKSPVHQAFALKDYKGTDCAGEPIQ